MNSYHKYIILPSEPDKPDSHRVVIFNEEANIDELFKGAEFDILSAGRVKFVPSKFGGKLEPDVVHGNLILGITVDTKQADLDKETIQKQILD